MARGRRIHATSLVVTSVLSGRLFALGEGGPVEGDVAYSYDCARAGCAAAGVCTCATVAIRGVHVDLTALAECYLPDGADALTRYAVERVLAEEAVGYDDCWEPEIDAADGGEECVGLVCVADVATRCDRRIAEVLCAADPLERIRGALATSRSQPRWLARAHLTLETIPSDRIADGAPRESDLTDERWYRQRGEPPWGLVTPDGDGYRALDAFVPRGSLGSPVTVLVARPRVATPVRRRGVEHVLAAPRRRVAQVA